MAKSDTSIPIRQYEVSDSDSNASDINQEPKNSARSMLYNFRVNKDYIRARIRHFNTSRRRPKGPNGETLGELDACGALLTEIRTNGLVGVARRLVQCQLTRLMLNGGWSFTHIGESQDEAYDVVAFATKWQLEVSCSRKNSSSSRSDRFPTDAEETRRNRHDGRDP